MNREHISSSSNVVHTLHTYAPTLVCINAESTIHITIDQDGVFFIHVPSDSLSSQITLDVQMFANCKASLYIIIESNVPSITIKHTGCVQNNAHLHTYVYVFCMANIHHILKTSIHTHAVSDITYCMYIKKSEDCLVDVENIFIESHGSGQIFMKGVAEDSAKLTYNGKISIGEHAGATDAYLTQSVLMLDTTAIVHALPGLEIKTNDVKASHSATVTKITPADLFYFGARGIAAKEAKRMFLIGFIESSFEGVPEPIRAIAHAALYAKIEA